MKTTVVNIKHGACDIYIGRGSKWGNPFKMSSESDRESVLELYERHIMARPDLLACIPELAGARLGCYCKPKACHGDLLARLANALQQKTLSSEWSQVWSDFWRIEWDLQAWRAIIDQLSLLLVEFNSISGHYDRKET